MKLSLNLTQLVSVTFFFSLLIIGSCSKENSQNNNAQQQENASLTSSVSDSKAEMVFKEVFDDALGASNDVGLAGTGVFGRGSSITGSTGIDSLPSCATVTITHQNGTSFFPVQIVIDFGTTGCIRPADGHTRKGKIITTYTNRLVIPGATATTTFDNFYIDDTKVEGTHTISNTSPSTTTVSLKQFTVAITNAKLSTPDGNYINWNCQRTLTQIQGMTTPLYLQGDVFQVTGSANGLALNGNLLVAWESTITAPLIKNFECSWLVQGTVKIVRAAGNTAAAWIGYLDYGAGNCDNQATITINGVVHQITLD